MVLVKLIYVISIMNEKIKYYDKKIDNRLIQDEEKYNKWDRVSIGNNIDTYKNEKERDIFRFLIKSSVFSLIFQQFLGKKNRITFLDYGCGNGQNSRIFAKAVFDSLNDNQLSIHTIYLDVSSILLKEAEARSESFKKEYPNFTYESVQINLNNIDSTKLFSKDYNSKVDFAFSIKFFHNAPIKINKDISHMIAATLNNGAIFCQQFYIHDSIISKIKCYVKFFLGRKYPHSIPLDIFFADLYLRKEKLIKVYDVRQKNLRKTILKTNHFYQHALERYYLKP